MATGASNSQLGLVLVDARKGVLTQTCRHSYILSLLKVEHVVLLINKMDLVDFDAEVFNAISNTYCNVVSDLKFSSVVTIPISALNGDNIITPSHMTPWYHGPQLLPYLEGIDVTSDGLDKPVRFLVQRINRAAADFRGLSGTLAAGTLRVGEKLVATASGSAATISKIVTMDGELSEARAGEAVTLVLDRELDISRGDILARREEMPEYSSQFQAQIIWMSDQPAFHGRSYLIKLGMQLVTGTITAIKFTTNVNTLARGAATEIAFNEVGTITVATDRPIAFDPYVENNRSGSFILIDRMTHATLGAGVIEFGLKREKNISYQKFEVTRELRAHLMGHSSQIVWFTGLSGSGKSTIAGLLEQKLSALGQHAYVLDGDNLRHGINKDLGFTPADRIENIRRTGEVARLMADAGLIVITSFISPFENERRLVREMAEDIPFTEVYVNTPLDVCERRDAKGLYRRARNGEIKNFTGISSPFEPPEHPDVVLDGADRTPVELADELFRKLFIPISTG
jgi:bifunctional enzyme CysN/CysC